ncbi:hypothetical protein EVAR_46922_1 [Eumeta japonica]|uniref:Uncharacterized protein n=1 Tax=Eumeta variegata TaxID=151549 RepID=A0A4C1Y191_EUMVA|nr:hypothetical protein EVAR_46922_1 [Eumeta japonica]
MNNRNFREVISVLPDFEERLGYLMEVDIGKNHQVQGAHRSRRFSYILENKVIMIFNFISKFSDFPETDNKLFQDVNRRNRERINGQTVCVVELVSRQHRQTDYTH